MTNSHHSALICVVDRWGTSWLGPYGNTWVETPAVNQLATESVLFENAIADSLELTTTYQSYWTGSHASCNASVDAVHLIDVLTNQGTQTVLVTDEPQVAHHPLASCFRERVEVPVTNADSQATDIHDTGLANLFSAALATLSELSPPFLLWIHARGMAAPWDAPQAYREEFTAEDDPLPLEFTTVPAELLTEDYDPDDILGIIHAYAGQISLLDECLAGLVSALDERNEIPLLTLLTSPRGFPLGEHRIVGDAAPALYSETANIPFLLRRPAGNGGLRRVQRFVQPSDVMSTLTDWFQTAHTPIPSFSRSALQLADNAMGPRDQRALTIHHDEYLFRTPAWQCKSTVTINPSEELNAPDQHRAELYAKPDDRYEANDVSDRCPDILTAMEQAANAFRVAMNEGSIEHLTDLPDVLRHGLD